MRDNLYSKQQKLLLPNRMKFGTRIHDTNLKQGNKSQSVTMQGSMRNIYAGWRVN